MMANMQSDTPPTKDYLTRDRVDRDFLFPYNWSLGAMSDRLLIEKVLEKFIFHDVVILCAKFGIDHIEQAFKEVKPNASKHELNTFNNIKKAFIN
jgi:hypothetical protein